MRVKVIGNEIGDRRHVVRRSRSLPPQRHEEILILKRNYSFDSVYDAEGETPYGRSRLARFQRWCQNGTLTRWELESSSSSSSPDRSSQSSLNRDDPNRDRSPLRTGTNSRETQRHL